MKTSRNFRWNGAVHETMIPEGNIIYSDVVIQHRKCGKSDPDRNLRIYEKMLAGGETLEPRHQLYYGRELYYHQRYPETEAVLVEFLKNPSGWLENKIDACLVLGQCYRKMGERKSALEAFLYSLTMDVPRAEICCEVGKIFLERELPRQAAYWYGQALTVPSDKKKGGFFMAEYHGFVPYMQLCVCYDKMGCPEQAFFFHKKAMELKPEDSGVLYDQKYFREKYGLA